MLIITLVLAVAALIILLVCGDVVRRRITGVATAWTQWHLVWVIVGLAAVVGANYLLPAVFKIIARL